MQLTYERFDNLFNKELRRRQVDHAYYREPEVFLILYNLLMGLKEFQLSGVKVGDIRPAQMVVTHSQQIKMVNIASFPWELTALDKVLDKFDNTTPFYLAP